MNVRNEESKEDKTEIDIDMTQKTKTDECHRLTLRLPKDLHRSMLRWREVSGQTITSQIIQIAMKTERDHQHLLVAQKGAHDTVMNVV